MEIVIHKISFETPYLNCIPDTWKHSKNLHKEAVEDNEFPNSLNNYQKLSRKKNWPQIPENQY